MHVHIADHRPVELQYLFNLRIHLGMVVDGHRLDSVGLHDLQKIGRVVALRPAGLRAA